MQGPNYYIGRVPTPQGHRYVIAVRARGTVDVDHQVLGEVGCYHEVLGAPDWGQAMAAMMSQLAARKGGLPGAGILQFPGLPGVAQGGLSTLLQRMVPQGMFPGLPSMLPGQGAPGLVAFGSGKTKQDAVSNLLSMANTIPGIPPEAKAGIAAAGVLWSVAKNPKVRKFAKKTLKRAKRKVKKLFKKLHFWH